MSKLAALVGDTGTGKSASIRNLNPKETYIINVAGKELPFKGSSKQYNTDNKNYAELTDAKDILNRIKVISEQAPHIKTIIIEDANYIMGFTMVNKATETGYTKFSVMAKDMVSLIQGAKQFRDDLTIIYFSHPEIIEDGGEIASYKMKTAGKLLDSQIVMEGLFTVVLYTSVETKGNETKYSFVTNRSGKIPAKSPMGMFTDVKIDNDLSLVIKAMNEYYS